MREITTELSFTLVTEDGLDLMTEEEEPAAACMWGVDRSNTFLAASRSNTFVRRAIGDCFSRRREPTQ